MTAPRATLTALVLLTVAATASGQFLYPNRGPVIGIGVNGYSYRHTTVIGYGGPYFNYYSAPITRVVPVPVPVPVFQPPVVYPIFVPQPIAVPQPIIIVQQNGQPAPAQPAPQPEAAPRPPAPRQPAARPPAPKAPPAKPVEKPPLPLPYPLAEAAGEDAKAEATRQLQVGQQVFNWGEYGRAAERFRRATEVEPGNGLAHFLLAQAQFANGKYLDAVTSIRMGMRLRPDWPSVDFRPKGLYGEVADSELHINALKAALDRSPEDPALLFLFGYQLWYNGRKDEARPFFRRAAERATDASVVRPFLDVADGRVVAN